MAKRNIEDLIEGRDLISVKSTSSLRHACETMTELNVGAVAVVDGGALVGILSERDVIRRCYCKGKSVEATSVGDIMTPNPQTIHREASVAEAMAIMLEGGFRHVPVVDQRGQTISMVSMRDIPTRNRLMVERYREYTDHKIAAH